MNYKPLGSMTSLTAVVFVGVTWLIVEADGTVQLKNGLADPGYPDIDAGERYRGMLSTLREHHGVHCLS